MSKNSLSVYLISLNNSQRSIRIERKSGIESQSCMPNLSSFTNRLCSITHKTMSKLHQTKMRMQANSSLPRTAIFHSLCLNLFQICNNEICQTMGRLMRQTILRCSQALSHPNHNLQIKHQIRISSNLWRNMQLTKTKQA